MATVVPPKSAKRARLDRQAEEQRAQGLADAGQIGPSSKTLVVQFREPSRDGQQGAPLGPVISLPAGTGAREMNAIVNQLRKQLKQEQRSKRTRKEKEEADSDDDDDDEDLPYSFHVALQDIASTSSHVNSRLTITKSLQEDVLQSKEATSMGLSEEDTLSIVFEPQAVFRVRPVRRCSSTLSGRCVALRGSLYSLYFQVILPRSSARRSPQVVHSS